MELLLPPDIKERLLHALERAGPREVGGIMMGEHVGPDVFRVTELTVQNDLGTSFSFVRLIEYIVQPLRTFFRRTNHEYTRFNYLGEWHSHPMCALSPSAMDDASMMEIVNDEDVGAHFVVLLLVKRWGDNELQAEATVYRPGTAPLLGNVTVEQRPAERETSDDL